MKKFMILFLFLILLGLGIFTYLTITKQLPETNSNLILNKNEKADSLVNCSDIRKTIEDDGKYYVACHGGVLVADKNTGKVLLQIAMPNGLSDYVTTDMIKKGNILYIGTQDGITIWDLSKNSGKKISVDQGLPSGANIILEEDGDFIWIGTFNGLARLNTKSQNLEVFRKELSTNPNEKININSIAVTKDYVYFSAVASAYSSGFVARYNKNTFEWTKYTTAEFGDTTQYARIDAMGMCSVNDGVVFTEDKTLWKISNFEKTVPVKVFTAGFNDYIQFDILCSNNKVLFKTDKNSFVYDNEKVRAINSDLDKQLVIENENKEKLKDYENIFGKDFYGAFGQILGAMDNNVYISGSKGIWVYNTDSKSLKMISLPEKNSFDTLSTFVFLPMEKNNKYLVGMQTCGMGCDKPRFYACQYPSNSCSVLEISQEVLELIGPEGTPGIAEFGYYGLLTELYKEQDQLIFKISISGKVNWAVLEGKTLKWTVEEELTKKYTATHGEVKLGDYTYKFDRDLGAIRIGKKEVQEVLKPVMSAPKYTPFEDSGWDNPQLNKLIALENKVYYCTNRGLWILDSVAGSWDLISVEDGLLSNDILDFWVTGNKMAVLTPAGVSLVE